MRSNAGGSSRGAPLCRAAGCEGAAPGGEAPRSLPLDCAGWGLGGWGAGGEGGWAAGGQEEVMAPTARLAPAAGCRLGAPRIPSRATTVRRVLRHRDDAAAPRLGNAAGRRRNCFPSTCFGIMGRRRVPILTRMFRMNGLPDDGLVRSPKLGWAGGARQDAWAPPPQGPSSAWEVRGIRRSPELHWASQQRQLGHPAPSHD
eukprot:gene17085-biopygen1679